jgi:hypothetical protein
MCGATGRIATGSLSLYENASPLSGWVWTYNYTCKPSIMLGTQKRPRSERGQFRQTAL